MYVGLGFDVHKFIKGRRGFLLGGVRIECEWEVDAVSDGDVVLHAVCDSLLGAAGLGDIGDYFPPGKEKIKGIESRKILEFVLAKIKRKFKIVNVDITIVADKPPLKSYKPQIVNSLKQMLEVEMVNLKVKSKEKTIVFGGSDSIVCWAIVSLKEE